MPLSLSLLDVLLGTLGLFLLHRILVGGRTRAPLPPGPQGLPIIGNVLDMPKSYEWQTYIEWSKKWGDIVSVTLFGQTLIILGSPTHAFELLERRSTLYSDRPVLTMCGELVGWIRALALTPYGDRFREYRKFFHRYIGSNALVSRFHPLVETESHNFLRRLLRAPDGFAAHIRKTAGTIILSMAYGYQVADGDDPYVDLANEAMEQFAASAAPGAFLVDIFPVLRFVPEWFPGAGFKKTARAWRQTFMNMADVPFAYVKAQMDAGTDIPNFTSELLRREKLDDQKIHNIKWSAASLYGGGADTTVSAVHGFFMAMVLFPEAQRKAQAEIDRVIGPNRLPTLADREDLPYVDALVKEVYRFNPVAPLGLPHMVTQDDEYLGYSIPKGAIVIANVWQFLHDPEIHHDPMTFEPARFLASEGIRKVPERDPREVCFGFGRRICPGLILADISVWQSCAMTLAAFDISHAVEDGKIVQVENVFQSGTVSHPKPFRCSVKARSAKTKALVLAE